MAQQSAQQVVSSPDKYDHGLSHAGHIWHKSPCLKKNVKRVLTELWNYLVHNEVAHHFHIQYIENNRE